MIKRKKILAVSIILLFFGIAVAPTINFQIVKASSDDDLVEVTSQACGIQGYKDTTMKLTREQYQDLEEYLVQFQARLNETTTREEALPLFKEAVIELHKYGLLPTGMNAKQAQSLVTSSLSLSSVPSVYRRIVTCCQPQNDMTSNAVCLIAGQSTLTLFRTIPSILLNNIASNVNARYLSTLLWLLSMLSDQFRARIPLCISNTMYIGYNTWESPTVPEFHLSSGWMTTIGVLGLTKTQGEMIGALPINHYDYSFGPFPSWRFYPAAVGFVGLKTSVAYEPGVITEYSYLGSALWVKIGSEPPLQKETT